MSEVIKVCVKQHPDLVGALLSEILLKKIKPQNEFSPLAVKFTIHAEYGPTKEDPFADHVTLTITE